jgi:hypothetical protein
MFEQSVFHVGMPRTSTTWHQNQLFPSISNYHFAGRRGMSTRYTLDNPARVNSVDNRELHDLLWVYLNRANRREWSEFVGRNPELLQSPQSNIISQELVLFPEFGSVEVEERIKRVSTVFPKIHIYITVRRQIDYLKSVHATSLKGLGSTVSQREYIELFALPLDVGFKGVLDYLAIVNKFENLGHRCSVMAYEELVQNHDIFLNKFSALLNADIDRESISFERHHKSDGVDESMLRYVLNKANRHFFGAGLGSSVIAESMIHRISKESALLKNWLEQIKISGAAWSSTKLDRKLRAQLMVQTTNEEWQRRWKSDTELDAKLMDQYIESNKKLADKIDVDLGSFGYF